MTPVPRWLYLSLLPAIAVALWAVDDTIQTLAWRFGGVFDIAEFDFAGRLLGSLVGPAVTATLFAYPIARLYSRYSSVVSAIVIVPVVVSAMPVLDGASVDVGVLYGVQVLSLCALLITATTLAHRALGSSRLILASAIEKVEVGGTGKCVPAYALEFTLLPILAVALFAVHDWVQFFVFDIAFMPRARSLQLCGLMLAAFVGPISTALAFGYPIARTYGRFCAVAGALISAPTSLYWAVAHLQGLALSWLFAAYFVVLVSLIALVPITAALILQNVGVWRLAVIKHGADAKDDQL
jgi:hypothetical protein